MVLVVENEREWKFVVGVAMRFAEVDMEVFGLEIIV